MYLSRIQAIKVSLILLIMTTHDSNEGLHVFQRP